MKEIWKDIKGYEQLYQISNFGRVRSLNKTLKNRFSFFKRNGIILNPLKLTKGYLGVRLYHQSKGETKRIHRLVAEAFIPNPDNLPCVNHKDENKENNCVDNLEWCSIEYNNNYGTRNERIGKTIVKINKYKKGDC